VVSFTLLPFYPRDNSPMCPLTGRLGVPQIWTRRCVEEKKLSLPGIESGPFSQSLCPLSYPGSLALCYSYSKLRSIKSRLSISGDGVRVERNYGRSLGNLLIKLCSFSSQTEYTSPKSFSITYSSAIVVSSGFKMLPHGNLVLTWRPAHVAQW
jgi:hypothetical protein